MVKESGALVLLDLAWIYKAVTQQMWGEHFISVPPSRQWLRCVKRIRKTKINYSNSNTRQNSRRKLTERKVQGTVECETKGFL